MDLALCCTNGIRGRDFLKSLPSSPSTKRMLSLHGFLPPFPGTRHPSVRHGRPDRQVRQDRRGKARGERTKATLHCSALLLLHRQRRKFVRSAWIDRRSVEKTMTRKISPLRLRRSATLRIPTQIILRFEMNFFSASLFQSSPPCSPCRPHPQIRGTGDESRARRRRVSQKSRIIRGKDYF